MKESLLFNLKREDLITVIIPVYNVEDYLDKCLKTVVAQSYKNLEIILVNDGSTDLSGSICEEWKKKDSRIKVIHKQNGGASDARNYAIEIAKGDYVGFIDADDYIELDMYENLHNEAVKYDADIISCGYYKEEQDNIRQLYTSFNDTVVLDAVGALRGTFLFNYVSEGNWTKLINKRVLREVRYKKGIHTEDLLFLAEIVDKSEKIVCIPKPLYHYVIRSDSSSNSKYSSHILDSLITMNIINRLVCDSYNDIMEEYMSYEAVWYIDTFRRASLNKKYYSNELTKLRLIILQNKNQYKKNIYLDKIYKLYIVGIEFNCISFVERALNIWFAIKR